MDVEQKGIKGEVAIYKKYKNLLVELVRKNVKLKYRNSWLGMVWSFLQPLMNMVVLALVFTNVFGKKSDGVVCYPIYLLTGRLVFEFFTQSTKKALRSFRENASIIKKVYVPKYMYPLSGVMSNYVTFSISILVLIAVTLFFKFTDISHGGDIQLTWRILLMFVPLIILLVLSIGVGLILSTLAVYFRDIEYIYDVFSTLLFYLMPVVYNINFIENPAVKTIILINPLYAITEMLRECVLYGTNFSVNHLAYAFGFSVIVLIFGIYIFNKKSDDFIFHI